MFYPSRLYIWLLCAASCAGVCTASVFAAVNGTAFLVEVHLRINILNLFNLFAGKISCCFAASCAASCARAATGEQSMLSPSEGRDPKTSAEQLRVPPVGAHHTAVSARVADFSQNSVHHGLPSIPSPEIHFLSAVLVKDRYGLSVAYVAKIRFPLVEMHVVIAKMRLLLRKYRITFTLLQKSN